VNRHLGRADLALGCAGSEESCGHRRWRSEGDEPIPAVETSIGERKIVLSRGLRDRLLRDVAARFPRKAFGYLLSRGPRYVPTDFVIFDGNIRNGTAWKSSFEAYGRYFVEHSDAGFVAIPDETWAIQQDIAARGLFEIGIFHSHQRHPANFSRIDYELHLSCAENLWHLIVSMRTPAYPRLRAFAVSRAGVAELELATVDGPAYP
jgi:proteasome lid subunit RPN8/RPN11